MLYKALFLGTIDYGSLCLNPSGTALWQKLEILQRKVLRSIIGFRQSTPNKIVYAETKELPLRLRCIKLAHNYILKILSLSTHPLLSILNDLQRLVDVHDLDYLQSLPCLSAFSNLNRFSAIVEKSPLLPCFSHSLVSQHLTPNVDLLRGCFIKQSSSPRDEFAARFDLELRTTSLFYTDGSKSLDAPFVGFAIFGPLPLNISMKYKIPRFASIFTAEALAIKYTLQYILANNIVNATVFTDSRSTLEAISNVSDLLHYNSVAIFEIKSLLLELQNRGSSVLLAWVPSHLGIAGNEHVDALAKEACTSGILSSSLLPFSDLRSEVASISKSDFHNFITSYRPNTGIQYMQEFYSPSSSKPWFFSSNLGRRDITIVCRMRSNHHSLAHSLFRKNIVASGACPCDPLVQEDLNHVIWACPRFATQRLSLLASIKKLRPIPPLEINAFLHSPNNSKYISIILEFIKNCKIQI